MTTTTTPPADCRLLAALLDRGRADDLPASAAAPKFLNDDPVWQEPDTQDASGLKADEVNLFVDLTYNLISRRRPGARPRRQHEHASTRCRTRAGSPTAPACAADRRRTSRTGPNTTDGPAAGPWTITSSKSDGVTPGLHHRRDATGSAGS